MRNTKRRRLIGIRSVCLMITVLSFDLPVWAQQDFASVQTSASSTLFGNTTPLPACATSLENGALSESTGIVSCSGGTGASAATIFVEASSTAPVPGVSLAAIGTRARIEVDTNGPSPDLGVGRSLDASALARFTDYLALGDPRPSSMVLGFHVDGTLDAQRSSSSIWLRVYAQSGHYQPGLFSSGVPFSEGITIYLTELVAGGTPATTVFNGTNAPDFDLSNTGPGDYTLTLGPSFFSNPANTHVRLEFSLQSFARLTVFWDFFGTLLRADSAFEHTARITDVRAYDAQGVDITSTAFAGFESVPEPGTRFALVAGVAFIAAATRRRGRASGARG